MLKPQDPVILAWIAASSDDFTFSQLATALSTSTSVIFESLKRSSRARLFDFETRKLNAKSFRRFILHAVEHLFPCDPGPTSRGVSTGRRETGGSRLESNPGPLVWSSEKGDARGRAVPPLLPSIPNQALKNPKFHAMMCVIDALRVSGDLHREWAQIELADLIADQHAATAESIQSARQATEPSDDGDIQERRNQIIAAAEKTYSKHGFGSESLSRLSTTLGMSVEEIKAVFPHESRLQDEVMKLHLEKIGAAFAGVFTHASLADVDTLKNVYVRYLNLSKVDEDFHRLNLWSVLEPQIIERITKSALSCVVESTTALIGRLTKNDDRRDSLARAVLFISILRATSDFRWGYAEHCLPESNRKALLNRVNTIIQSELIPAIVRRPSRTTRLDVSMSTDDS